MAGRRGPPSPDRRRYERDRARDPQLATAYGSKSGHNVPPVGDTRDRAATERCRAGPRGHRATMSRDTLARRATRDRHQATLSRDASPRRTRRRPSPRRRPPSADTERMYDTGGVHDRWTSPLGRWTTRHPDVDDPPGTVDEPAPSVGRAWMSTKRPKPPHLAADHPNVPLHLVFSGLTSRPDQRNVLRVARSHRDAQTPSRRPIPPVRSRPQDPLG